MLFDLRSRGRRRTVQVIYIGLAVLIGAGLILFGVGTGTGGGGLFGAFTGGGSSTGASGAVKAAATKAQKKAQADPSDAAAWAQLVTARFSVANAGFNSTTGTYNAAGKQQLALVTQAWKKYESLAKKPSVNTATLAARSYSQLGQYAAAADAYQAVTASEPSDVKGFECVAIMSYAAKNTRVGQLAENKVLAKVPKATAKQIKPEIEAIKSKPSLAPQLLPQLGC
jgi:tetratricopeptide (TPR) repeat protein